MEQQEQGRMHAEALLKPWKGIHQLAGIAVRMKKQEQISLPATIEKGDVLR